jgi:hypothetical protein
MEKSILINSPVVVTSLGFGKQMQTYPKRIEYNGDTYRFVDSGIRAIIKKSGEAIAQILTMTDGRRDYHLKNDLSGGNWFLISIN